LHFKAPDLKFLIAQRVTLVLKGSSTARRRR
jgi:hypothetical protein